MRTTIIDEAILGDVRTVPLIKGAYDGQDYFLSNQQRFNFWLADQRGDADRVPAPTPADPNATNCVLTLPGIGSANQLPVWFTVLVISRDVAIVLTVAVVNLAVGPRTFRPSIYGKVATALYIVTGVAALYFNYLDQPSLVVQILIYASLVITFISAGHYAVQVARMAH